MAHDTYVYKDGHRYTWICQTCGASGERHRRRMDADDAANAHEAASGEPRPSRK